MRFTRARRRPAWTYSTRGILWRLQTGSPEFLVGEDRIPDAKKVSFFCLDRRTGFPRWEGYVPGEGWWSGIETVAGGLALFHGFASPDMPLHRGLTAVDLLSGSVVWARSAVRFLRVEPGTVLVARDGPGEPTVERLELLTGTLLKEVTSPRSSPASPYDLPIELPHPFAETEFENPGLLAAVRNSVPEKAPRESVLVMPGNGYCVVFFCEPLPTDPAGETTFRSSLLVLGGPRWEEVFSAVILPSAGAIAPEPFFCQNGVLYFVRERSTLVAVPLLTG